MVKSCANCCNCLLSGFVKDIMTKSVYKLRQIFVHVHHAETKTALMKLQNSELIPEFVIPLSSFSFPCSGGCA